MLVEETTIDEDEEARQAYDFEHNMKVKNGIWDRHAKIYTNELWDENMKKIVDVMHEISDFYEIPVPRYYFLKNMGKARGTATPAWGHRSSGTVCLRDSATVYTAIHEMAHIVCFHLEKKGAKQGHGHGSLFIGILTYLYQRLGYWDDEIRNIPLFACEKGEDGEYLDMLEYDFDTLHEAGYLPKDEYTNEVNVKMFLQRGNYRKVLAMVNKHNITEACYNWYITGHGVKFTKEEKQSIREKLEDIILSMEDDTIEGISGFASNCYDFNEEDFKEDPLQHIADCYIDGITEQIFDFISYNGMDLVDGISAF